MGHRVRVKFTLRNRSKHSLTIRLWFGSSGFTVNAADGTTYDTGALYAGLHIPPPFPRILRAGSTLRLGGPSVSVRWTGPLQITPYCLGKSMRALRVGVEVPWPRPVESDAIGEVAAAAGHLLDNCLPQTPGVAVDGQIDPPGDNALPMDARCSVSLNWDGNFLQAQVLVLIPPDLPDVQIYDPYELLWPLGQFTGLAASPPYEAIAWEFVVTRDRAIPVATSTIWADCTGTGFGWGGTRADVELVPASC